MSNVVKKKLWRSFKLSWRHIFRKKFRKIYIPLLSGILLFIFIYLYASSVPRKIEPQAYIPILNTIAEGESKGNYNAYFGNAGNSEIRFTEMNISEVQRWQEEFVKSGQPSSAVGRYQIIRPTLNGLVKQMNIKPDEKFNEELQDRMAITLLERRGSLNYVNDKLSREEFAANIAKEWAALPKIIGENPDESYYEGDGLNKSRVDKEKVFNAIQKLKS